MATTLNFDGNNFELDIDTTDELTADDIKRGYEAAVKMNHVRRDISQGFTEDELLRIRNDAYMLKALERMFL